MRLNKWKLVLLHCRCQGRCKGRFLLIGTLQLQIFFRSEKLAFMRFQRSYRMGDFSCSFNCYCLYGTGMVTLIRFYLLILGRSSLWLKGIYWSIYYKSNQSSSQNILSLSRILSSSSNSSIHLALYFSSISSILYSNYLHIFWTWAISLLVSAIYSRKVTCIFSTFWSLVACSMRLIDNWSLVCFIC